MGSLPEAHYYPLIYHKEHLLTHDFRSASCGLPGIDTNTYHLSRWYTSHCDQYSFKARTDF